MMFNSFEFLIFFPIVTGLFFYLPQRYRWLMLLIASCIFYMSFIPIYILILFFTIIIDYYAGLLIESAKGKKRKTFLLLSIISNVGVLALFKYYNFINENLTFLTDFFHSTNPMPYLNILLPIGLSFHTFQAMSYTIEVYRGNQKAERHFGIYALYVMFFPQLVAGPIERPQNLLHQFYEKHKFKYKRVTDGLKLMLWGLFKKIVIADRLAIVVSYVYSHPHDYTGIPLILATVFFAFQIYCDFSGYSDIAIGAAQVLGFKLMDNFNRPYFSKSISEFWKRWHISLSSWFKDYLYISIGGNRVSVPRWYFNLFIVFLVSGIWHGAKWTFVIWGALHGFYLVFSLVSENLRMWFNSKIGLTKVPRFHSLLKMLITFVLVTIGWVFFRADSVSDAIYILTHMFVGISFDFGTISLGGIGGMSGIMVAFFSILLLESVHIMQEHIRMRQFLSERPIILRWSIYVLIILAILFFGVFEKTDFIYFQF